MAGFGLFLGGVAKGIPEGLKAERDYEDNKRQKEVEQGQRESEAILQAIPQPGTEVEGTYTPDKVVTDALEKAKPKPDLIQRFGHAVMTGLRPHDAAAAAGVTPPPVDPNAAPAAAIPAGADAGTEVAPMTVQALGKHELSDVDRARLMVAAASRLRGPDATSHVQAAWENMHKVEQEQTLQDIGEASLRGKDALANKLEKITHHQFDIEPAQGKDGFYNVTVDGTTSPQPMTLAQMTDAAIGIAKSDPSYALQAGLLRSKDERDARELLTNTQYKQSEIAIHRAQVANERRIADATANHYATADAATREGIAEAQAEHAATGKFVAQLQDQNGAGDALLNEADLTAQAAAAPMRMKGSMTTKVVQDEDGNSHTVTVNNAEVMAKSAIEAARKRYQSSPFVKGGVISVAKVPMPDGSARQFYVVKGISDGGFTNLDAAELKARRMYPQLAQPAKPAAKTGNTAVQPGV